MTEKADVDAEELRAELDQIKEAMGIQERYSGAASLWLLFGVAVPVAAALSQYVQFQRLPHSYHTGIWVGILGGAIVLYGLASGRSLRPNGTGDGKPSLWLQFAILYLAAIPLQWIAGAYAGDLGYVAETGLSLSIILVVLGLAYGVFGTSLRAYHVRQRDRYVFYVGTAWMIGLALAIPHSSLLEEWAFAAFGGLYFVYAVGAYFFLRVGGDGGR